MKMRENFGCLFGAGIAEGVAEALRLSQQAYRGALMAEAASSQQPHEIFQKTNPQLNPSVMSAEIYPISWGAIFFLIFMGIINYNLYFFFLSGDFYSLFLFLLLILFSFSYLPRQRFKIL